MRRLLRACCIERPMRSAMMILLLLLQLDEQLMAVVMVGWRRSPMLLSRSMSSRLCGTVGTGTDHTHTQQLSAPTDSEQPLMLQ